MITHSTYTNPPLQPLSFLQDLPTGVYPVFGVSLEEAASLNELFDDSSIFTPSLNKWENSFCLPEYQKYVPQFLLQCIKFINDSGLQEEGLYRISGSGAQVRALRDAFIKTGPSYEIPQTTDVHAVTSLVKNFTRYLTTPILPITSRHTFLAYTKSELPSELTFNNGTANFSLFTAEEQDLNPIVIPTQILQEILQDLPAYNFALVHTLTRHFSAVIQHASYNRMSLASLALIFCPTLKIHKSVFHALILKSSRIWENLHPIDAHVLVRGIRYDSRNIVSYRQDILEPPPDLTQLSISTNATSSSFSSSIEPSSSNASLTEVTGTSIVEPAMMDPISFDLFDRRESLLMRPEEDVDDLFECNIISFGSPHKLPPPSTKRESFSSFSSSTSNTHLSDAFDFPALGDYIRGEVKNGHPVQEYRYKLPSSLGPNEKGPTRYGSSNRVLSASGGTQGNNRKVFLRKSVANF